MLSSYLLAGGSIDIFTHEEEIKDTCLKKKNMYPSLEHIVGYENVNKRRFHVRGLGKLALVL